MGGTILVAGGAGYIGSHVCKALARNGSLPVCYDDLSTGHASAVKWGPLERGRLGDGARLTEVIDRHRPSAVVLLAGFIAVGESVIDPARYYLNNVAETITFLDVLKDAGISQVIFSSSAAVYGAPRQTPVSEDHPTWPANPYGWTKLMVERMLADYAPAYGMRSVALRYFNAAGADPDGEIGEDHDPETHLIPLVLDAALGRREAVTIFGNDYDTPDGSCVRDYIHVSDLADAHILALGWLQGQAQSTAEAFNLGNGNGYSVKEVIASAGRVTNREIPTRMARRRSGDPAILVSAADHAKAVLGWTQRHADLETQIAHAWAWHRKKTTKAED
jgi:UDP-arabinose 4-epimerase